MAKKQCWQVWYTEKELCSLNCSDAFCQDCITNWWVESISTSKLTWNDSIKCINYECDFPISHSDLIVVLPPSSLQKINDAYLGVYLSHSEDVAVWPRSGCNYAGVVVDSKCNSPLTCLKCEYEWQLPTQMSFLQNSILTLRNLKWFQFETFSYMNDVAYGKQCPKWNIVIFKDGGWDQVKCTNCWHRFCWYWQGLHNDGKKSQNENCIIPRLVTPLMVIYSLLMLNFYLYNSLGDDMLEKIEAYFNAIVYFWTLVIFVCVYMSMALFEVVLIFWCKVYKGTELKDSEILLDYFFKLCALVYPPLWTYGLYTFLVLPLL